MSSLAFITKNNLLNLKQNAVNIIRKYASQFNQDQSKFNVPARYARHKESIWNSYIQLAMDYKPLSLGPGYPDYGPPDFVVKALADVVNSDNLLVHQYTRGYGHPRLVKAISSLYSQLIGRKINPMTEILITTGAYEALYAAIHGHIHEGDEVIIIEPFFDSYGPLVQSAGGVCRFISLKSECHAEASTFKFDIKELEKLFNNKTKMIILNNPNSQIGKAYSKEELDQIAKLCQKHNVLCLADEVFEWSVFPNEKHIRISSLPGMWDKTLTIGSAGKTFNITGWRIGWAYGPSDLLKNLQLVHQYCVYTCNTPVQEALAISFEKELSRLGEDYSYFKTFPKALKEKSDHLIKILHQVNILPVVPQAGIFMLADWQHFADRANINFVFENDKFKDVNFTKWLIKNVGILTIPTSYFYTEQNKNVNENFIRLCFFKKEANLRKANELFLQWKEKKKLL